LHFPRTVSLFTFSFAAFFHTIKFGINCELFNVVFIYIKNVWNFYWPALAVFGHCDSKNEELAKKSVICVPPWRIREFWKCVAIFSKFEPWLFHVTFIWIKVKWNVCVNLILILKNKSNENVNVQFDRRIVNFDFVTWWRSFTAKQLYMFKQPDQLGNCFFRPIR